MKNNINIFEDDRFVNFFPLTYMRPIFDLRCGILKLRQKISFIFSETDCNLILRTELEKLYENRFPQKNINRIQKGKNIFVNGSIIVDEKVKKLLFSIPNKTGLFNEKICIGFRTDFDSDEKISSEDISRITKNISRKEIDFSAFNYIWEIVDRNSKEIISDYNKIVKSKKNHLNNYENFYKINSENIFIGKDVSIEPNVVLDATKGSIFIDDKARLMSNCVIKGPVYIGKNSVVKVGAKIYSGTSLGKMSKVGGEIEETIFQGYSNKQHDGFLGHSYLGEFVNLGADTNNSNLKNNYKTIKSYFYPMKKFIDTNLQFFGMVIGDHSKSGINTTFNTGCVIGLGCNLYSADLFSGFIPSFSWGTAKKLYDYRSTKMLETAEIVKKRRNLTLNSIEKNLFINCFKNTKMLREIFNG